MSVAFAKATYIFFSAKILAYMPYFFLSILLSLFLHPVLCFLDFSDVIGARRALLKCDSLVCFAFPSMLYYYVHCICAHGPIWLIALIKYLSIYLI